MRNLEDENQYTLDLQALEKKKRCAEAEWIDMKQNSH